MYTTHFGLREMPFSITPDPAYLYMSPHHQEALGHLLYGTGQYGGFVQLTGEVGTGKTTIVRTLLAQKLDNVDVAVILNPRQNETEFVAAICDELGITYPKKGTLKSRVDALNEHLLKAHAEGRRTVVLIDEAQNLQPEVLEQVRLLTNLETDKEKLLRIMLVGQPELATLLARPDLRQLAQRITARYHLTPLEPKEIAEYIGHRLKVAGGNPALFTPGAVQMVQRHSRGIPRLVNVLCDRALLGAYATGAREVSADLVERAAREVGGDAPAPAPRRFHALDAGIVAAIIAIGAWWFWREQQIAPAPPTEAPAVVIAPVVAAAAAPSSGTIAAPPALARAVPLDELLRAAQPLPVVLASLTQIWGAHPKVAPGENVCQALSREKLGCYKSIGDFRDLQLLDRPAILTLTSGRGGLQHVLLRELSEAEAMLETATGPLRLNLDQLGLVWTGEFLMVWRRETEESFIGPQVQGPSIVWLRQRLAAVEQRKLSPPVSGNFDEELREALLRFQTSQGLDKDGLAGPRTLIALSNLKPQPGTPTLRPAGPR
ncbi:MAG TPA: AAA family ATPase [Verrucomicrobiae bacterium]|nr:AAA family ATPase [Verrucomicrobiae bacterium]